MSRPSFSAADRRARLAHRHLLLRPERVDSVSEVCNAMVGLHASDPVTVYLSAATRLNGPTVEQIEDALYAEHAVARHHAMRRTLWIVTPEVGRTAHASSTVALVGPMRRSLSKLLVDNRVTDDAKRWLDRAVAEMTDTIGDLGQATARQIGAALPHLRVPLRVPPDHPSGATIAAHTRVLTLMGFMGIAVRGRPNGTWVSGQYRWMLADDWLNRPVSPDEQSEAAAALLDRYLRRFGPASTTDIVWWTGWGKRVTAAAIETARAEPVGCGDQQLWVALDDSTINPDPGPWVTMLPGLDSTVMGWKQRDWYLDDEHVPKLFDRNGNAGPTVWADGKVVGTWAQTRSGEIVHELLEPITTQHQRLLADEAERLRSFLGDTRFTIRFPAPLSKQLATG